MADFAVKDIYGEIDRQAETFGIDPRWAKALLTAENTGSGSTTSRRSYSGDAVSSAQARGVLQVIPSTAKGLQQAGLLPATWTHDPNNLGSQVSAGLAAMKDMQSRNKSGTLGELAAMYNGGNWNQKQWQSGGQLSPETQQYLPKVFRAYKELGGTMGMQEIERAAGLTSPSAGTPGSGGSRTTSTGTRTTSLGFGQDEMDDYIRSAGLAGNALAFAKEQVAVGGAQREALTAELMQAVQLVGQTAGAQAQAKAETEAVAAARRNSILGRMGLDADLEINRATKAMDIVDQTTAALEAMRPEIDQRMATGFFDNPLLYLINQTILPGQVAAYNQVVKQQQDALGTYRAAKEIASSTIDLNQATDADQIKAQGVAVAAADSAQAQAKLKEVQLTMSGKVTADALTLAQLGTAEAASARERLMLSKQTVTETEGMSETQRVKAEEERKLSDFNKLVHAVNGKGFDMGWYKQLTPAMRNLLQESASRGTLGSNFSDALEFFNRVSNTNNLAVGGQASVAQWLIKAQEEASSKVRSVDEVSWKADLKTKGKPFDSQKAMQARLEELGQIYTNTANINMRAAPDSSPLKLPYVALAKDEKFAGNVYAQEIAKYGPGSPAPLWDDKIDEQQVLKKVVATIQASPNPTMAIKKYSQDIAAFYKTATEDTALKTKWPLFGLSRPTKTYAVQLPLMSSKDRTVDLGDAAQVENVLTKQIIASRWSTYQAQSGRGLGINSVLDLAEKAR